MSAQPPMPKRAPSAAMPPKLIYHLCKEADWRAAQALGLYLGSADDARDGFIHFSTGAELEASAAKHRAGQTGLVLLAVDVDALGEALKWEPAREGVLFPHLYAALPVHAVRAATPIPLGPDGLHRFPPLEKGGRA